VKRGERKGLTADIHWCYTEGMEKEMERVLRNGFRIKEPLSIGACSAVNFRR
jgi:hypothetical protein